MATYDFIVVLDSTMMEYSASGIFLTRVPHLLLGIIIANNYEVLVVLGQGREILGKKWSAEWGYTAPIVRVSVLLFFSVSTQPRQILTHIHCV
jgi:hypothetical protein